MVLVHINHHYLILSCFSKCIVEVYNIFAYLFPVVISPSINISTQGATPSCYVNKYTYLIILGMCCT